MNIIDTLYASVGIVVLVGYMPQIFNLIRTQTNCPDISIPAWLVWLYTAIVSLLYSFFILEDLKLNLVNTVNVTCITIIILVTAYKRYKYKAPAQTPES